MRGTLPGSGKSRKADASWLLRNNCAKRRKKKRQSTLAVQNTDNGVFFWEHMALIVDIG
jgi:hypothetical protein